MAGQPVPLVCIIRAANKKTFRQVHREIRAAHRQDVAQALQGFKAFQFLPTVLSTRLLWWLLRTFPRQHKQVGGTVILTSVGMFGKGSGWGIPVAEHPLSITLGGIAEKPAVVDGQIAIRQYLSMTLSFDHSLVDGAPAARFTGRLKDLIESGYGLPDSTEEKELAVASGSVQEERK